MSADALSEVLRAVRLTGAIYFTVDAAAPWVAEAPPGELIRPRIMPGVEHVIEYHLVTRGGCWAGLIGEAPVRLETGDVIVFPQGDAHVLSSEPGMRGDPDLEEFEAAARSDIPILVKLGNSSADRAHVVCGFLGCDARPFNPLLASLPKMIHVRRESGAGVLQQLVELAVVESNARKSGSDCVLSRLSELLFIEAVRRHVAELPVEQTGWFAGLRDPHVGRALTLVHHRPERAWTLDDLAKDAGVSRSVLADRFAHLVGLPPMQYLAQWRMQLAAGMLANGNASLAEIAVRVGYGSEAALSRAFKRLVGVSPALWRGGRRAGAGAL